MNRFLSAAAAVVALPVAAAALPQLAAATDFTFTLADSSAGVGSGPYGTVSVTQNATDNGNLDFLVTLASGFTFHQTQNSNHEAFAFKISGDPSVTLSDLTSGFTGFDLTSGTNFTSPPFNNGSFFSGVSCTTAACGNTLSFTVDAASDLTVDMLSFIDYNGNNVYFTADVLGGDTSTSGKTGNVGAVVTPGGGGVTPGVPEPSTWALMLVGFAAVGAAMRRRQPQHIVAKLSLS
jgi:hypothetical protein